MTKSIYDPDTILDTAMQIIQDEHLFFVHEGIDNNEHIPRIIRIAQSTRNLFENAGIAKKDINANIERIIQYGRQLFIDEWMKPILGETETPNESEAIESFEYYRKKYTKK